MPYIPLTKQWDSISIPMSSSLDHNTTDEVHFQSLSLPLKTRVTAEHVRGVIRGHAVICVAILCIFNLQAFESCIILWKSLQSFLHEIDQQIIFVAVSFAFNAEPPLCWVNGQPMNTTMLSVDTGENTQSSGCC